MAESKLSMKLLMDTRGKRVLFAEANKDCVDFLFYLLSLPVATVIRLLGSEGMEGSLPTLYKSLENLNDTYLQPNQKKDTYLKPAAQGYGMAAVSLLGLGDPPSRNSNYSGHSYGYSGGQTSENGGLVKGVVTYMVMDDLEVKPMSTISSLALLNSFKVKDVGALEEKVVKLGMDEAVKLLKTSLQSKTVLTDLYC